MEYFKSVVLFGGLHITPTMNFSPDFNFLYDFDDEDKARKIEHAHILTIFKLSVFKICESTYFCNFQPI